jgi:hypothetical protein
MEISITHRAGGARTLEWPRRPASRFHAGVG